MKFNWSQIVFCLLIVGILEGSGRRVRRPDDSTGQVVEHRCNRRMKPVCASNGMTYPNKCAFKNAKLNKPYLRILHFGECHEESEEERPSPPPPLEQKTDKILYDCRCPLIYRSVCGTDGVTYSNICQLRCAKNENEDLEIDSMGPCEVVKAWKRRSFMQGRKVEALEMQESSSISLKSDDVSTTESVTKESKLQVQILTSTEPIDPELAAKEAELERERERLPVIDQKENTCRCKRHFHQVCGSDGSTYANLCRLQCAQLSDSNLTLKSEGKCPIEEITTEEPQVFKCVCTDEQNPVCGSDRKTYVNPCLLNCAQHNDTNLKLESMGRCRKPPRGNLCACVRNLDPVCGSNVHSYSNNCTLHCSIRLDSSLKYLHDGECTQADLR